MAENRINVDLKIFQAKELESLADFGRSFAKSVERLTASMDGYQSQVENMASTFSGGGGGGGFGRRRAGTASDPGGTAHDMPRTDEQKKDERRRAEDRINKAQNDLKEMSLMRRFSFAPPTLSKYEEAGIKFGNIGQMGWQDKLRYLSYFSGAGAYKEGADGGLEQRGFRGAGTLGKFSGITGGTSRAIPIIQSMAALATLPYQAAELGYGLTTRSGITQLGLSMGVQPDRVGPFGGIPGTGWMAPALEGAKEQLGRRWDAFTSPYTNYETIKSVAEARRRHFGGKFNRFGDKRKDSLMAILSGEGDNDEMMLSIQEQFGGEMMGMMANAVKFAPRTVGLLEDSFSRLYEASKKTGMGIDEFTEQLMGAYKQVAQATGLASGEALAATMAFSEATNVSPAAAASILGPTDTSFWMTVAKNEGSFYKASMDVGGELASGYQMAGDIDWSGTDEQRLEGAHKMFRTAPDRYRQAFGDMTPDQVIKFGERYVRGGVLDTDLMMEEVRELSQINETYNEGKEGSKKKLDQKTIDQLVKSQGFTQREEDELQKELADLETKDIENVISTIQEFSAEKNLEGKFDLTARAAELLNLIPPENKSNSNSQPWWSGGRANHD